MAADADEEGRRTEHKEGDGGMPWSFGSCLRNDMRPNILCNTIVFAISCLLFRGGNVKCSNRIGDLLGRVGSLPEILQAFLGPSRGRLGQPTERHAASWVLGSGQL